MHVLIVYGSLEGQTQKISERIGEVIVNKGHHVTTLSAEHLPGDFSTENYDAVIVGGSIHMNKYPKHMTTFVSSHRDWLNNLPSAFFTVCMAVNSPEEKSTKQGIHYGEHFLAQTGWQPSLTATFAGAVKYTQYNFITRFIMKMISKHEGGSTDTSRDHEYTDWENVKRFAETFIDKISE
jgi:menaquinone-dependent protoporphyrinogen oxidase